ncbi:DUF2190 family protein [Shewanella avicenniae]|uniref:DUF2190 family protein n=1 Tax=Shewanella avicenniae TaxID=2814294 RepID=A0ABX7QLY4_9GAMM|nr:capsid cement protein [Shewanella avicenniae]QSX32463.1 DUF2190 family protein [Shewanella avicenniae]
MRNEGLVKTFVASGAIPRYRIVALAAGDNQVALATSAADPLIGVSQEPQDIADGERIDVTFSGIVEVEASGVLAKGAWITADANGRAVVAGDGAERIGRLLDAANVLGDIVSLEIIKN